MWSEIEMKRAIEFYKKGDCEAALGHLGKGLHSIQDMFAHRDWDPGFFGMDPHPPWYDVWDDPRNASFREQVERATNDYLMLYRKLTESKR